MTETVKRSFDFERELKRCVAEEMRLVGLTHDLVICGRKGKDGICAKEGDCDYQKFHLYVRPRD